MINVFLVRFAKALELQLDQYSESRSGLFAGHRRKILGITARVEEVAFPNVVSNKYNSEELPELTDVYPTWYRWWRVESQKLVKPRWISRHFCLYLLRRLYGQTKYLNPEWGNWWVENKGKGTLNMVGWRAEVRRGSLRKDLLYGSLKD
jgi:hypothetical protein